MQKKSTCVVNCTIRYLREGILDILSHIFDELFAHVSVHLRLMSEEIDPDTNEAKVSRVSKLRLWWSKHDGPDSLLTISFTVDQDFGMPAAVLLESFYSAEFFLISITLQMPDGFDIYFPCHTWVNHTNLYFGKPRVFFSNRPYLPNETPMTIVQLRKEELLAIRGDGRGQRLYGQRIYDYDVYNDFGNPDHNPDLSRPILGGSSQYPYPRRCRTGRKHTKSDPLSETPETGFNAAYVPRDEMFSAIKRQEFLWVGIRSVGHNVFSTLERLISDDRSFENLQQILCLYEGDLRIDQPLGKGVKVQVIKKPTDGTALAFPPPGVVQGNERAWDTDLEYGRQRLAGVNPVVIQRMESFPPMSILDPKDYGPPTSCITFHHLEPLLEGLEVEEALQQERLYIVDYHDAVMPFVERINQQVKGKVYASRTILYLRKDGPLVPVAIELTLPPTCKGEKANSRVFTANKETCPEWLWRLAKAHVAIVDTGYHQLVSHWLHTHASIEPFVIATRRQFSAMHPLHLLLSPHFKDTMHINALARSSLINAGGKIESNFTPGQYSMEISSAVYKSWRFDQQALPKDLLKRRMAVEDRSAEHGLRLTIENYPYAVDGLDVWAAIEQWVDHYVKLYYKDDEAVREDEELQGWWDEVVKVGHGDHAGAEWWSEMKKVEHVIEVMSTLIWMASALHAAVNFGQYAYSGYMPNNPTTGRRLIPEEGTPEYKEMAADPDRFFLDTVPTQGTTTFAMAILEILAHHMSEEEYLGQRKDPQWSCDPRAIDALRNFRGKLAEVGVAIERRNEDAALFDHRMGRVYLPYTLLHPVSPSPGLSFSGIPNSISI